MYIFKTTQLLLIFKIDFPVAFGPAGVIGVAAAKDIPNCSVKSLY